jgi:hypothetical protein
MSGIMIIMIHINKYTYMIEIMVYRQNGSPQVNTRIIAPVILRNVDSPGIIPQPPHHTRTSNKDRLNNIINAKQ